MTAPQKKSKTVFACSECGHESARWLGRCPACGEWESMREERKSVRLQAETSRPFTAPVPLSRADQNHVARITTGIDELDRTLGGGIVPGAVILIGGDPGIGKSTLLLQTLAQLGHDGKKTLYVTGEESIQQIHLRAKRISSLSENLLVAAEDNVEAILAMAEQCRPDVLAVDSVQTLATDDFPSAPGSVTQVRESTARLLAFAKASNTATILVGHITKEGAIAGPKVLEHMVDAVLTFEGDRGHTFRLLRTIKNRFGSTNEIGVFTMNEEGLVQVPNPSEIFLAERPADVSGSVVMPSMEGTRPILVEVQALVSSSTLATPRRTSIGADPQRLALLTAVLEKKAGIALLSHDIFCNIAGGIRINEPALDLGVIAALASSAMDRPIPANTAVCGEVGLAGEVRAVGHMDRRVSEAARLGFQRIIVPQGNLDRLEKRKFGIDIAGVSNLIGLLEKLTAP